MDDDDSDSLKAKAVPIPADILVTLRQDGEVKDCVTDSDDPPFDRWFIAIPIDLYGQKSALLLLPQTTCVMGANIQGFRIFVRSGAGHKEIFLAYAMSIDLLETKSSDGHRDIGIIAGSAATEWGAVYRFNGTKYLPVRCWQHRFTGPGNPSAKIEAIPCSPSTEKPYR
jgi:hypothetical protein